MEVTELRFPVVGFTKYGVSAWGSAEALTTTFASWFRAGGFDGLEIIDSAGRTFRVRGAGKLGGAGPFWGYSLFYDRRIRVYLELDLAPRQLTPGEVKEHFLEDFSSWDGWESRGDLGPLRRRVADAGSVGELTTVLSSAVLP